MLPTRNAGQFYIGFLISLAILGILSAVLFTLVATSYELVNFSRARITARHLAQEKLELIRNLPFDDVGTSGGIPSGPLPQTETIVRNGLSYTINVDIVYVDDPFDDLAPVDLLANDYKRVRVDVSWEGLAASRTNPVTLISDIAPRGIETTVGGGTLSILVFDALGQPVPQADVTIVAPAAAPPVDLTLQTDTNGRIILPGAPTCDSCYEITATKSGFSTDRTYSTVEVANPNRPHQTILEGELTQVSFAIDQLSTLSITTVQDRSTGFLPYPNRSFTLRGSKVIGTDVVDDPVYKYNELLLTDALGEVTVTDVEWDIYDIILPSPPALDLAGTNPIVPFSLDPNTTVNLAIALTSHTPDSLLAVFLDQSATPVASVAAELKFTGPVASGSSGLVGDPDWGQVFFPGLNNLTYTLESTAAGFQDATSAILVDEQTIETTNLIPL